MLVVEPAMTVRLLAVSPIQRTNTLDPLAAPLCLLIQTLISSTTQCFFAWRIARLTGRAWIGWAIAVAACLQLRAYH